MLQNDLSRNQVSFEQVYREYADTVKRVIVAVAMCLGVVRDAEDLEQDCWLRTWRRWPRVKKAHNLGGMLKKIAVRTVISYASRQRVRVHIAFEVGIDVAEVLRTLNLERAFVVLDRPYTSGLPLYSGRIWPSRVEDLRGHPSVVYFKLRSPWRQTTVDWDTVICQIPDKSAEGASGLLRLDADGDCRRSLLGQALDELSIEYPVHIWILVLRSGLETKWSEIAGCTGLRREMCMEYHNHIKEIFRQRYPELATVEAM